MAHRLDEPEFGRGSGGRHRWTGRYAVTAANDQTRPPHPWRETQNAETWRIEGVLNMSFMQEIQMLGRQFQPLENSFRKWLSKQFPTDKSPEPNSAPEPLGLWKFSPVTPAPFRPDPRPT
jgi:hypothetical protein